ncbi:hypothetical protein Goshw_029210 [Gossypium schwendimanii]|uniref:Uncharacterized protein n=1 Tax=Gossypium schwendimanii TaxID=34291 RepID=A0A7J9M8B6_GOSSC|nr:hypothetical protein [Gossypium schwendimanii]
MGNCNEWNMSPCEMSVLNMDAMSFEGIICPMARHKGARDDPEEEVPAPVKRMVSTAVKEASVVGCKATVESVSNKEDGPVHLALRSKSVKGGTGLPNVKVDAWTEK